MQKFLFARLFCTLFFSDHESSEARELLEGIYIHVEGAGTVEESRRVASLAVTEMRKQDDNFPSTSRAQPITQAPPHTPLPQAGTRAAGQGTGARPFQAMPARNGRKAF